MKRLVSIALLLIITSACLEMGVYHEIKRDGNSDIEITISSEVDVILNSLTDSFYSEEYEEWDILVGDGYVRLTQKDVPAERLFEMKSPLALDDEELLDDELDMEIGLDLSDSILENPSFEQEFNFPYFYFTLNFEAGPDEGEETEMEGLEDLFSVNYEIKPFGEIVETNGLKTEKGGVRFNLMPPERREYNLVFRDLFIYTLLGQIGLM